MFFLVHNTGDALYDGIIGVLGAIVLCSFYFLFIYLKALWKERYSLKFKAKELFNQHISRMIESKVTEDNTQKSKENVASSHTIYCKNCGKEISQDASYCNFCGSKQDSKVGTIFSNFSKTSRIALVLTGIWAVCHLVLLYSDNPGKDYIDDEVWLLDTNFSDYYAYGNGEFVFYALFLPVIAWGLSYIYVLRKTIGITIIIIMSIALVGYFGTRKYHLYQTEQREKAINDSIEAAQNAPIINRTFVGCSFADSFEKVHKRILSIYKNDSIVIFIGVNNGSPTFDNTITLFDVDYGNKSYEKIKFYFYQNKLSKVRFYKKYKSYDSKMASFNSLIDLFESKNYPHNDLLYNKYSNSRYYSDKYTRLELRYSVPEFDGEKEQISIVYYDTTSGQEDSGL